MGCANDGTGGVLKVIKHKMILDRRPTRAEGKIGYGQSFDGQQYKEIVVKKELDISFGQMVLIKQLSLDELQWRYK